jgi:hypothetical protein
MLAVTGIALAIALAPAPPAAADTAASTAAPPPFAPGEQIDLSIEYLRVHTGQARIAIGRAEGAIWPVLCQGKTDGLAALLDIREHYVSYWDVEARNSRGSDLNAIEVGDRHTDRSRFDRENGKATVQILRNGRSRQVTRDVPRDVRDLASALLELRMRPLARGATYDFPVFSGSDTFVLRAEVEGDELLSTPAGRFQTMRVRVRLGFKDKFQTKRDAHVWISTDERRIPVRMSAEFAVGTVTATLTAYRPGSQVAAR